jgi:hypothetical protein
MEREIDLVRRNLGEVLDRLHAKQGTGQSEARLMIEDKIARTVGNGAFITTLSTLYARLKQLESRSADAIFDEEVRKSVVRKESSATSRKRPKRTRNS